MSVPVEIERRWLCQDLSALPNLDYVHYEIIQGYLTKNSPITARIRKQVEVVTGQIECFLTYKGRRNDLGEAVELEYLIPQSDAEYLLQHCEATISKNRYVIGTYHDIVHLDVFQHDGILSAIAEVEFATPEEATAYTKLDWFATEITDKPGYSNFALAFNGWPSEI